MRPSITVADQCDPETTGGAESTCPIGSMYVKGLAPYAAARAKVGIALVAPFGVVLSATGTTLEGRQETKANWAESTILLPAHGADIGYETGRAALDASVRAVARA
jgi:hypothetical protein